MQIASLSEYNPSIYLSFFIYILLQLTQIKLLKNQNVWWGILQTFKPNKLSSIYLLKKRIAKYLIIPIT